MSATVVGARGFVGRRLAQRLAAEGAAPWTPAKGDPQLLKRDLGVVYYCAGLTADYDRRPFDTVEAHATLISEILRAGRFDRLIYCSSSRLYDGLPQAQVDESVSLVFDPADPRRVYDLSKALGENLTLARSGGRGVVARLSNVYDVEAGAPGFLSEWLAMAAGGRDLILQSSPNVRRDYIHLEDVVSSLIAMAGGSGIYNVAAGQLTSNAEIAEAFAAEGWSVGFTGHAHPLPPPNVSAARLAGLGVKARPVKEVIRDYLRGLKA